jgi:hypothetical protein
VDVFEAVPVLSKDLFEDVPVLGGRCNHQGAPSGGSGFAVQLLYHGSSAQSTPSSAFTEAPSPTSLTRQPRGLQGNPQMEIPVRSSNGTKPTIRYFRGLTANGSPVHSIAERGELRPHPYRESTHEVYTLYTFP